MASNTLPVLSNPQFSQVFTRAIEQEVSRVCQRVEVFPRPDQTVRARNRKISAVIGYLHSCYLAAQQLGLPELAETYRGGYQRMMAHWSEVERG